MKREFLNRTSHRPFPLPDTPWVLSQSWAQLLFAHWPVPAETIRHLIPDALEIDTFDGSAWIGVVPFAMKDVSPRFLPKVGPVSNFLELNVRTYVKQGGIAGVYFFSLDCSSAFATWVAKTFYHLPYYDAVMKYKKSNDWISYESMRDDGATAFKAIYRGTGERVSAQAGSIDHFLTERYCLYTTNDKKQLHRGVIHHDVWPLQHAEAEISTNSMTTTRLGFDLPDARPLLHYSENIDTVEWPLKAVI